MLRCTQVIKAPGVRKDADYIAQLHIDLAADTTGGAPDRLLGVLMDNTKANCKAMKLLEEQYPVWLCIGCQAHGLSLLIKDLANPKKAKWSAATFETGLLFSNTIGDSERVRALVQAKQRATDGKVCAAASEGGGG